jgi:hypothetical protein
MEITLKNISHNERLSEETNCFSATIYIDGKKAGEASNHGHGGPTMLHPRELEQKIDAYAKTLPPGRGGGHDLGDGRRTTHR